MTPSAKTTKTTCPYCGVGCGVLATVKPDGQVKIRGDESHPANFGRLCSKGSALGETVDLDGRLLQPEVDGNFTSWDHALNLVANTFKNTIEAHGPDSIAFYVSGQLLTEDYYVANKLMKGFIGSANIDTNSRLCMASSVAGHKRAFGSDTVPGTYEDLELADVIVLVGSNLAWCHPVIYQRIAAAKAERPDMKIVLIDPRRTMTNDIADIHLAIAPDGDTALFAGLLAHLAEQDALSSDYIANHTAGFVEALSAAQTLSRKDITAQTGLSDCEIDQFYSLWTGHKKVVTLYSQGVNQSSVGTDKVNAIINCHLATGRIGKPGMGPFSITGQPNAMGGREVGGLANMLAAHMDIENPEHRDKVQRFWNAPKIADKPGLKAVDMFGAVADGRIKAIWIMATNPVDSMPNADAVADALAKCPFVVVSDVNAETDTTRYAHVKLPSLGWGEKDGTVTNSERRISRQKAFLPAPGDAKPDWWQMAEVAKRMGFDAGFEFKNSAALFKEFAAQTAFENEGARDLDIGAYSDISTEAYADMSPFQWPARKDELPASPTKRFFANGGFYTPNGKANFVTVIPSAATLAASPFPYILNTGRIRDHWHTMTRTAKSPRLSSHIAEPFVEIHPIDSTEIGVKDADLAAVSNAQGEIIVRVLVTDRVQKGQCFVPMHFTDQITANARVDKLVPPLTDKVSGQPALKKTAVQIAKFPAKQFGFVVSKQKPNLAGFPYWALAKIAGGWRAEFAHANAATNIKTTMGEMLGLPEETPTLDFQDQINRLARIAAFEESTLVGVAYFSPDPVSISRSWLCEQLQEDFSDLASRWRVVASRPANNMPDKGAIICACMNVGANEIANAVYKGSCSIDQVGKATTAGTNCGSCRAEIKVIIDEHQILAAE